MSERRHGNEGGLTRPDPALARTSAEFIECLRLLKLWVGDPSFKELRRRCKVPASTLSDALNPKVARLPRLEVVRAFVSACGVTPADEARWVAAWRALRLGQSTAAATASAPPSVTIPRQSPRDLLQVIGRDDIIDRIDAIHREHLAGRHTSPLVLITGPSGTGTGTSAVALFWAQQRTHAFPDGHLYLDLRVTGGADHAGLPLLLRQLGVPEHDIPPDPDTQAGLYRSITADRQLLIVVDNADDADQVEPLLPGGRTCYTLVTSGNSLPGLITRHGAIQIRLAPLQPQDTERLIASVLGHDHTQHRSSAIQTLIRPNAPAGATHAPPAATSRSNWNRHK